MYKIWPIFYCRNEINQVPFLQSVKIGSTILYNAIQSLKHALVKDTTINVLYAKILALSRGGLTSYEKQLNNMELWKRIFTTLMKQALLWVWLLLQELLHKPVQKAAHFLYSLAIENGLQSLKLLIRTGGFCLQ